jgi:hypothetical protein
MIYKYVLKYLLLCIDLKRSQKSASESDLSQEDLENEWIDDGKTQYFNTTTASRREVLLIYMFEYVSIYICMYRCINGLTTERLKT